jgi:hypothetical protein
LHCGDTLSKYTTEASGSGDLDFDAARAIMQLLHSQKTGIPFEVVTIHARPGWGHPIYKKDIERFFTSRVNASGVYEQWGSECGEGLRVEDRMTEE